MRFTHDQILAAGCRFSERGFQRLGPEEHRVINLANMSDVALPELANLLRDSIREAAPDDSLYKSTAYWALAKKHDPRFRDFFLEMLPLELETSLPCAWQIVIALECIGEDVLSPATKMANDDQLMVADARSYLNRLVPLPA